MDHLKMRKKRQNNRPVFLGVAETVVGSRLFYGVGNYLVVSASVRCLCYQPMDEKIKTWTLRFPTKENPNMEKALFDSPIVLQCDVRAKHRLIFRKFSSMKFFYPSVRLTKQKPRAFVSVR